MAAIYVTELDRMDLGAWVDTPRQAREYALKIIQDADEPLYMVATGTHQPIFAMAREDHPDLFPGVGVESVPVHK